MQINLPNLVKTLGEHLYSDPNVAIRELLQNAHDACEIQRAMGSMKEAPRISIHPDADELVLTVTDNGTGLTRDQVNEFLTVIGSSQTHKVREELEKLGRKSEADRLIGRFGLGLLSAFTIGHRVEFLTRSHAPEAELIRWWCDGGIEWKMISTPSDDAPPGTSVTIHVDPQHIGLLNSDYLVSTVRRYTEFLEVPVFVGSASTPVNAGTPPWAEAASEADYRAFLQRRYPYDEILAVIPVDVEDEASGVEVRGALFIPDSPSLLVEEYGDVTIYCHRYFVCDDNRTLLPKWARFVRGVVDSPNLKEMTDREHVVEDDAFERVRELLGKRILAYLDDIAQRRPDVLDDIVRRQNITIKAWALTSEELFACIRNRAMFKVDGGLQNLDEYLAGAGSPRHIYYTSRPGASSQFVVLARARGTSVIDASSFPDRHFLEKYARIEPDVVAVDLDQSGMGLFDPVVEPPEGWKPIERYFAQRDVVARLCYFEPARIPAILTREVNEELDLESLDELLETPDLDQTIKRVLRATRDRMNFERERRNTSGRELNVNARSPIVKSLLEVELADTDLPDVLDALYNNAFLLSYHGDDLTVEILQQVFDGQTRVIAALIARALMDASEDPAARPAAAVDDDRHVTCFLAMPFEKKYDDVQDALARILSGPPYFFEVSRADRKYFKRTVENNVEDWIKRAECFAVDISGANPNVMMELGLIYWNYRDRPLLLLCNETQEAIADLQGMILIRYPSEPGTRPEDIEQALRAEIEKIPELRRFAGRKRFLSTVALDGLSWLATGTKQAIADAFPTIEDFLAASPETVRKSVGDTLPEELIPQLREKVAEVAGLHVE